MPLSRGNDGVMHFHYVVELKWIHLGATLKPSWIRIPRIQVEADVYCTERLEEVNLFKTFCTVHTCIPLIPAACRLYRWLGASCRQHLGTGAGSFIDGQRDSLDAAASTASTFNLERTHQCRQPTNAIRHPYRRVQPIHRRPKFMSVPRSRPELFAGSYRRNFLPDWNFGRAGPNAPS